MRTLLEGLESLRPDIIILMGNFISSKLSEKVPFDQLKTHFEFIGSIIREHDYKCLRDATHWIFVPSTEDPGQPKLMPCLQFQDFFLTSFKGNGPQRIKNISVATNPFRLSYYGKEIVVSRYNYFKKLKRNQLAKIQIAQEKTKVNIPPDQRTFNTEDSYKIAKTLLH